MFRTFVAGTLALALAVMPAMAQEGVTRRAEDNSTGRHNRRAADLQLRRKKARPGSGKWYGR